MAKKKTPIDWLLCGPDPWLATCERCGKHEEKPPMGISLTAFVKYMRYVEELHRHCPADITGLRKRAQID